MMNNNKLYNNEYIIFFPLLIVYAFLAITYNFLCIDILKFILFQLLFILLPGYLFSELFISIKLNNISKMILGVPVSLATLFILSLAGKAIGFKYFPILLAVISIVSLYKIIIKPEVINVRVLYKTNISIIAFYSLCISLFFVLFTLSVTPPSLEKYGIFYQDSLWTVGNTWSVLRFLSGDSLVNARFLGLPFTYHMLQNIYQANVHLFTGIDPFNIHFYLEPLFDWFIIISIFVIGGIKIAKIKIGQIIIFGVLLFFVFSPSYFTGGYLGHLYYNPLSMFFGFSSFILFIYLTYSFFVQKKSIDIIYLLSVFLIIFSTKAHLIIIIPISLLLMVLILKKFDRETLFVAFGVIIIILILKITIYNGVGDKFIVKGLDTLIPTIKQYFNIDTAKLISIKYLLFLFYLILKMFKYLMELLIDPIMALGILLVFLNNRIYNYLKKYNRIIVFSIIFTVVSFIFRAVFVFWGGGYYFTYYSRIILLFITMIILYRVYTSINILDDVNNNKLLALNIICTIIFIFLIFHDYNDKIIFNMYSLKYSIFLICFLIGIILLYFYLFNKNLRSFISQKNILGFRNIFTLVIIMGIFNFTILANDYIKTDWCYIGRDNKKIWDTRATVDVYEWKAMKCLNNNANSN